MFRAKETFAAVTPAGLRMVRAGAMLGGDDLRVKGHERRYDEVIVREHDTPEDPPADDGQDDSSSGEDQDDGQNEGEQPTSPSHGAPKAAWVAWAVDALGVEEAEAAAMTKNDLIELAAGDADVDA